MQLAPRGLDRLDWIEQAGRPPEGHCISRSKLKSVSNRLHRSRAELVENSEKVLYKIWMFAQANRLMLAAPRSSDRLELDQRVQFFALLESMLIHARELMLFLYARSHRDYIRAAEYLPDPALLPPKWEGWNDDMEQINARLAHLTWGQTPANVTWTVGGDLTSALMSFVKLVPKDRVINDFKTLAWGALADQSSLARLIVAPQDGSAPAVRGHRVDELLNAEPDRAAPGRQATNQ